VRTHPVTKRKALFVNGHFTTHIDGLAPEESRAILNYLCEHSTREEFQVRFPGSLIRSPSGTTVASSISQSGTITHRRAPAAG
jgi:hypothetical protein